MTSDLLGARLRGSASPSPASAATAPIWCSPAAPSSRHPAAWPCERLRVADRGLREGILDELMAEDGVWRPSRRDGAVRAAQTRAKDAQKRGGGTRSKRPRRRQRQMHVRLKTARKHRPSSQRWLERQLNDPYVAAREARGLSLARGLQADRDRRQVSSPEAGPARRRSRRRARRLVARSRPSACSRSTARGRSSRIDYLPMDPLPGVDVLAAGFPRRERAEALKALLRDGGADVVLSDMAAPTTGHTQHRPPAHHGARRGRRRFRPRGAHARRRTSSPRCFQGGTERELLDLLKRDFATVRHVKPPASRADSAELYVLATGFRGRGSSVLRRFRGSCPRLELRDGDIGDDCRREAREIGRLEPEQAGACKPHQRAAEHRRDGAQFAAKAREQPEHQRHEQAGAGKGGCRLDEVGDVRRAQREDVRARPSPRPPRASPTLVRSVAVGIIRSSRLCDRSGRRRGVQNRLSRGSRK